MTRVLLKSVKWLLPTLVVLAVLAVLPQTISAKRYNASLSFGGGFRFSALQFNVGSQIGLIDVSPSTEYSLRQNNPLSVTLSIMF